MNIQTVQNEAVRAAMEAKRDFEIGNQTHKVRELANDIGDRLDALRTRLNSLSGRVSLADEVPAYFSGMSFGKDTETLDALLVALSEESQILNDMTSAKEATSELMERFDPRMAEAVAQAAADGEVDEDGLHAVAGGAYL